MARQANVNIAIEQQGDYLLFGGKSEQYHRYHWFHAQAALAIGPNWWRYWDDFRGNNAATLPTPFRSDVSTGATIALAATNPAAGLLEFITDTDSGDHATLTGDLVHLVSNGWAFMEARINNVTAITVRDFEVGFSDAISETNGLAFSSHDATPVAVADNAAVFGYNAGESTTNFSLLSVNATTASRADSGVAVPAAATFTKLAIAIGPAGQALFYINGTLIERRVAAVATTAVLTPWVTLVSTSGAAKTFQLDYILAFGQSGLSR